MSRGVRVNTVGIVLKPNAPQGKEILRQLILWLTNHKKTARVINLRAEKSIPRVDIILVLGGDGTLLAVARCLGRRSVPILAVNLGHLGFLTEIAFDEMYAHLTRIFETDYETEPRMMLCGFIGGNPKRRPTQKTALNDIVIHKGASARGIAIEVRINGADVTEFRGDGLIIASATGSTAYTLSAGGPIVHPSVEAIVLTPIAPHILTNRPIVVPASSEICVRVNGEAHCAEVAFDGQEVFPLTTHTPVRVRASAHRLNLIRSQNRNYYQVLREKLRWGTGSRIH